MKKKLKISKKSKSQDWEILEDDIPTMPNGGYSWSTNTAQAPKQQVVGSVENTQTSKPSIQPFQKGYVNPNIITSKTGEEGLGDDLGGMMITTALAPGSLPFRASSRLGKVGLEALELANPISGFKGIKPKFALQNADPILTNQTKGFNVEYDGFLDFQKKAGFKPYKFDNKNWYDVSESNLASITEDIVTPQGFQNRVFDSNVQLGFFQNKGHLSEKGFNYRTLSEKELESIQNNKGVFPKQGKAKGGNENVKYWTKGNEKNWYGDNANQQFIRVKENKFVKDKVVRSDDVEFFNHQTGKFEPISNYKPIKKLGGKIKLKPKSSDWEIIN